MCKHLQLFKSRKFDQLPRNGNIDAYLTLLKYKKKIVFDTKKIYKKYFGTLWLLALHEEIVTSIYIFKCEECIQSLVNNRGILNFLDKMQHLFMLVGSMT